MKKSIVVALVVLCGGAVIGQVEPVGKGVFPPDEVFGFSMAPDKSAAYFVRSFGARDTMMIYTSARRKGKWQTPAPVSFTSRKGEWKDIDPFVSPDGKQLFFQSNRGLQKGSPTRKRNFDLWVADKTAKGWSPPRHLGPIVNSDSSESFLSASSNGNIYFSTNRAGGFGKLDIYVATFADGSYHAPQNLGMQINSTQHELNPFIAADESFMIWSRQAPSREDSDLYISFHQQGRWTKPWNLGSVINSGENEFCPFMVPGEDTLYFARLTRGKRFVENIFRTHLPVAKLKEQVAWKAEMVAPGVISTGDVLSTAFDADGSMYFVRSLADRSVAKIFRSAVISGVWQEPELLPLSMIDPFTVTPYVTRDGSRMIFCANQSSMDLWVSERTPAGWGTPYPLPGPVNQKTSDEYFPSVSNNGTLYFASSRGLGGGDLFRSRFINGEYQEPEPLLELNTPSAESNPLIAPDESYLIFMALRSEGFGDYDLYISYNENGKWTSPVNLGPSINSDVKDFQPAFSPDGKFFYFSRTPWPSGSDKRYGEENIYRIDSRALPLKR